MKKTVKPNYESFSKLKIDCLIMGDLKTIIKIKDIELITLNNACIDITKTLKNGMDKR